MWHQKLDVILVKLDLKIEISKKCILQKMWSQIDIIQQKTILKDNTVPSQHYRYTKKKYFETFDLM